MKSRDGKSQGREEKKKEDLKRKKIQVREKVGKSRNTVFPMARGSRGSKSRLAKAAGAEPGGQIRDEKLHAIVAQSTCPSQNVQFRARFEVEMSKKWAPLWREAHFEVKMHNVEHFWKLRCRKSARRCGAKHISKSKCTKHTWYGALLEVEMSKKCTPLWREAHFQSKV